MYTVIDGYTGVCGVLKEEPGVLEIDWGAVGGGGMGRGRVTP